MPARLCRKGRGGRSVTLKIRASRFLLAAGLAALWTPQLLRADAVKMYLDPTGSQSASPQYYIWRGEYVNSYSGWLTAGSSQAVHVIANCDDLMKTNYPTTVYDYWRRSSDSLDANSGQGWTQAGNGSDGHVALHWGSGPDWVEKYRAVAGLSMELLTASGRERGILSWAIWDILDPANVTTFANLWTGTSPGGFSPGQDKSDIEAAKARALLQYANAKYIHFDILTPTIANTQEMLIVTRVPEPGFAAAFGLNLFGLGAWAISRRRRAKQS